MKNESEDRADINQRTSKRALRSASIAVAGLIIVCALTVYSAVSVQTRAARVVQILYEELELWRDIQNSVFLSHDFITDESYRVTLQKQRNRRIGDLLVTMRASQVELENLALHSGPSFLAPMGELRSIPIFTKRAVLDRILTSLEDWHILAEKDARIAPTVLDADLKILLRSGVFLLPLTNSIDRMQELSRKSQSYTTWALLLTGFAMLASIYFVRFRIIEPAFVSINTHHEHALQFQADLLNQQALLAATFLSIRDPAAAFEADGTLVAANEPFAELFGDTWIEGAEFSVFLAAFGDKETTTKSSGAGADLAAFAVWLNSNEIFKFQNRDYSWTASEGPSGRWIFVAKDSTGLLRERERDERKGRLESIGQIAGGVAHDFNNLLAVVMGNAELLSESVGRAEDAELLEAIVDASKRGADLTKNLLSFARKANLEPEIASFNQVVQDVIRWAARVIPENIEIETSMDQRLWQTEVDPVQAQNALLNIIINARDAMLNGGKLGIETSNIRLSADAILDQEDELRPGRYVRVSVSDTGTGIPEANMDQIFAPFFSTKPVGLGTGLGLSMIQGFMQQSGGTVRISSEVDVGTTVMLYFKPVAREVKQSQVASPKPALAIGQTTTRVTGRIFVVEDEPAVLRTITASLESAGYEVRSAVSGEEALPLLGNSRPDVLITDIVMPGQYSGPALVRELRKRWPDLPVILMSGYASEGLAQGIWLNPDDIKLMKPIGKATLVAAIEKLKSKSGEMT